MPEQSGPGNESARKPWIARWLSAFGMFWWDFLVGDTPELFIGTVGIVGVGAILTHAKITSAVTVGFLPVLAAAMLALTVARARPRN